MHIKESKCSLQRNYCEYFALYDANGKDYDASGLKEK